MIQQNKTIAWALAAWANSTDAVPGQDSHGSLPIDPDGRAGGIGEDRGAKDMRSLKEVADKKQVLLLKGMIVTPLWPEFGALVKNV